jgi:HSP20 family protein
MNKKNCNNNKESGFFNFDFDQIGKTLEDFFQNASNNFGNDFAHKSPLVNVYESDEGLHIDLAAPGLRKEDFKVTIEGQELQISADTNVKEVADNVKIKRKEFAYSTFSRKFRLSDKYDANNIAAKYEAGILKLHIGLKEKKEKDTIRVEVR